MKEGTPLIISDKEDLPMSLSPSTWSAKSQSLACILVPALVAALNAWRGWNLDSSAVLGLFGLGAAGALSVAHIDHGEPATSPTPDVPHGPSPADVDAAKATLRAAGVAVSLFLACAVLTGCGTVKGLWSDVQAVTSSPAVKADVAALETSVAKLRGDLAAAGQAEGPDVVSLASAVSTGNYVGAVADLVTVAPQLAATGGVVLADGKAVHAALSKLVTDSESAVRLARAAAKLNAAPAPSPTPPASGPAK